MNNRITIRPATIADRELIAEVVCMAVGYTTKHPIYPVFLELAGRELSQYSYRNVLVAEVDGCAAGAIVGYDGSRLEELRHPIFELIERHLGYSPTIEDESDGDEFYLDSLGILPQYRGMGVGSALLIAMRDMAFDRGFERVGLIVDVDNPAAERLYASLGFKHVGDKRFLGHAMHHLQASRN